MSFNDSSVGKFPENRCPYEINFEQKTKEKKAEKRNVPIYLSSHTKPPFNLKKNEKN